MGDRPRPAAPLRRRGAAPRRGPEADTLDPHDGVAPLADLLFAVATIVIALLVAVLPSLVTLPAAQTDHAETLDAAAVATGASLVLLADADGLTVADRRSAPASVRTIPTSALIEDPALPALLAAAAPAATPPAVVIEEGGSEAAFVLEGLLARAGIARVQSLRLAEADGSGS